MTASVEKWGMFEAAFAGPASGNPFVDVTLEVEFSLANRRVFAPGFYDGDGVYRVRLMPDAEGEWSYRTRSNDTALDGLTGGFVCQSPSHGNHGPVRVRNRHHFAYADGTPYFPFGTTCYAWTHQPLDMQRQTLESLQRARFNKLRMGVFPKHYVFNENEPLHDVYQCRAGGDLDFNRPNVVAFRHFESQVAALAALGVEADVIVFHPYDRWGYCTMTPEQDERYVRYLVARLAAFRNVWWSLANEYDFLLDVKPVARWDLFFHLIEENDPARHLKSIHNGEETMPFDHRKPWVDHVCIQNWNVKRTADWRRAWGKPIVNDELEYEGDISLAWGNLTAQELTHRFWTTLVRGGYAGHGECYAAQNDNLWWAKGGTLRGESWKRIAFLRSIIEEDVKQGLTPASTDAFPWSRVSAASEGDYKLIYLGEHQPAVWAAGLPQDDRRCEVDVIDAWNMTITSAKRVPCPVYPRLRQRGGALSDPQPTAAFAVALPAKPYQAIRIRPADARPR
jgi:hypothetical protein